MNDQDHIETRIRLREWLNIVMLFPGVIIAGFVLYITGAYVIVLLGLPTESVIRSGFNIVVMLTMLFGGLVCPIIALVYLAKIWKRSHVSSTDH
jgi:hypothetical protein